MFPGCRDFVLNCMKWNKHVARRCQTSDSSLVFSLTFQILPQTGSWWYLHNQKRTVKPRSCPSSLPCAMPKSDTWPGGVALDSLSKMDSAGSFDSVISMNSGYVSAALNFSLDAVAYLFCCITHRLTSGALVVCPVRLVITFHSASVCCWNGEIKNWDLCIRLWWWWVTVNMRSSNKVWKEEVNLFEVTYTPVCSERGLQMFVVFFESFL